MSSPKFAETDSGGQRWYILDSGERFMSVTTVLGYVSRFGLLDWAAKLAAEAAIEHAERVMLAAETDPCNATKTGDACGKCRACVIVWLANQHNVVRDAAADLGTRLHEATGHFDVFGEGGQVDDDVLPLFDNYRDWLEWYRPTIVATDVTVISRKWGYAGSLDKIVHFGENARLPKQWEHLRGLNAVLDEKTGKHVGIKEGWQVSAYSRADSILLPDGSEQPIPAIGGGLILHNRADKLATREVYVTDANFMNFVHTLRMVEGLTGSLNSVLSRPVQIPKRSKLCRSSAYSSSKPRSAASAWASRSPRRTAANAPRSWRRCGSRPRARC